MTRNHLIHLLYDVLPHRREDERINAIGRRLLKTHADLLIHLKCVGHDVRSTPSYCN
jgi:hypothetical protein